MFVISSIYGPWHFPKSPNEGLKRIIQQQRCCQGKKAAGQAMSWHTLEAGDWLKSKESAVRVCVAWPFSRASICSCVKLVLFLCSFLLSCSLSWDSSPSSRSTGTPPPLLTPPPPASPPMLPSVSSRQPSDTGIKEDDKRGVWVSRK